MTGQTELPDEDQQIAVLLHVLIEYPANLSAEELRRELLADDQDFARTDAHDRAVRDLIAAGLLRRNGDSVSPTRAAVHFYNLHG